MKNVKVKQAEICESQVPLMVEQMKDKHYLGIAVLNGISAMKELQMLDKETAEKLKSEIRKAKMKADEELSERNKKQAKLLEAKREIEKQLEEMNPKE